MAPPMAVCPACGEEQYVGDRMFRWGGRLVCARCAYRRESLRRRERQEEAKDV